LINRYVGSLIAEVREKKGETDYSDDNGIPQSVPIEAANHAQQILQALIYEVVQGTAPAFFDTKTTIDCETDEASYDLPEDIFLGGSVSSVKYSCDGSVDNYVSLQIGSYSQFGHQSGDPGFFCVRNGIIEVDPIPDHPNGDLQICYHRALDSLALRVGRISARTIDGDYYTDLTLAQDSYLNAVKIQGDEYLCVNSKDGEVVYYNIGYSDYDTSSRRITFDTNDAPTAGGTISVGDFITLGRYTTTHSKLDRVCEGYFKALIARAFDVVNSSYDAQAEETLLKALEGTIINTYRRLVRARRNIPYTGKFEYI
jgi:hypothetical protein